MVSMAGKERFKHPAPAARAILAGLAAALAALVLIARADAGDNRSKLDPRLRSFMKRVEDGRALSLPAEALRARIAPMYPGLELLGSGRDLGVPCLMMVDEAGLAVLRSEGVEPQSRVGDIVTVTVPYAMLDRLESMPGIRYVEMSRPLKPCLDVSGAAVKAPQVHGSAAPPYPAAPAGYTGRNVVVGIIDTGLDLQHGDFRNGQNRTRVNFLWDQTDGVNPGPPQGFTYGREWTAANIDAGQATQTDTDGHGTHIAGIAAGDGSDTGNGQPAYQYIGIAPEASIIAVKSRFDTQSVTDAVTYILSRAGSRDAVVNLSLGTQDGPHDGSSLFDQAISALTGPGHIVVAAAGNESNRGLHARLSMPAGVDSVIFTFRVPTYTPSAQFEYVVADGWYEGTDTITFRLESPTGRRSREIMDNDEQTACLPGGSAQGRVHLDNNRSTTFNNDKEIYIEITDPYEGVSCGSPGQGVWKIIAYRRGPVTPPGNIDFWLSQSFLGNGSTEPEFLNGVSNDMLVTSPASAANVISVGAYLTKRQWVSINGARQYSGITDDDIGKITSFSSPGPLRDGRLAPTITAPGMGIASVRSAAMTLTSNMANFALVDGKHFINQGTSQSAPHVAGAVALLLERHPHETPAQIIHRLTSTAARDAATGPDANNTYGYGKLDVLAAGDLNTPTALSLLEALPADGQVVIHWVARSDEPWLGFHVSRGEATSGPFERLTQAVLTGGPEYRYVDSGVVPGREYWYLLEALSAGGGMERFGPISARVSAPRLRLEQNGPNPFAATTTIRFAIPEAGPVRLAVYNVSGRLVRVLLDGPRPAGSGETTWDGTGADGGRVPEGVYFYKLSARAGSETRKMVLNRQ